jgi:ribonuclease BN (tRNA processing enzyme)
MMRIRVLGCSGGIGVGLHTTSLLIDDDILIDAGTGIGVLSLDEMAGIRHIFLTHAHLDHIACLPLMVDSIFDRIKTPIVIHAQAKTVEALQKHIFNWAIWPDFSRLPTPENPVMCFDVIKPGEIYTVGNRNLELIPVNHIVPTGGYRIVNESRVFAYSGDTTTNDRFWEVLNSYDSLDLLIVESAFSNTEEELSIMSRHYCPRLLAADLAKLRHQPDVYITHNKPGGEEKIFAECLAEIEGREIKRLQGDEIFRL